LTVAARAASVTSSGRKCTAPQGTALAALAGVRRAGGPTFALTGGCGASLYVRRIGAHAARGYEGWVYKVGNRAATAGAADPGGPFARAGGS
ncbi:hypothetical protein OFN49_31050, partial [Escherichia coli]|nr:hypothetical protein [Escherichia coli]